VAAAQEIFSCLRASRNEDAPLNIECPATMLRHVQKVLGGEYEVPYQATIERWPDCHVHCYEPLPDNFALLKRNLGHLDGTSV
jgi:hypothetical protein